VSFVVRPFSNNQRNNAAAQKPFDFAHGPEPVEGRGPPASGIPYRTGRLKSTPPPCRVGLSAGTLRLIVQRILRILKYILFLCVGGNDRRYLHVRSLAMRFAAAAGLYEARHIRFLRALAKPGDAAVDVGANFGAYTLALSRCVGDGGKVLAFEPIPAVLDELLAAAKNRRNVRCLGVALGDVAPGEIDIHLPKLFGRISEPALASLKETAFPAETLRVSCARLDDFADELDSLAFVKADIEGAEEAFLRGAAGTLRRRRPVVQFEANDIRSAEGQFHELAESMDYRLCRLSARMELSELPRGYSGRERNFYLVPAEKTVASLKSPAGGRWTRFTVAAVLAVIVAMGAALRFYGQNWDSGAQLNPDERFIMQTVRAISPSQNAAEYFNTARSKLNPANVGKETYVYGTLPLFALKFAGVEQSPGLYAVGRTLSALADLLTLLLVFIAARKLFGDGAALSAAALYAFCVLPIQLSHFFIVDPLANMFCTAAMLLAVCIALPQRLSTGKNILLASGIVAPGRLIRLSVLLGLLCGAAMACKISAAPAALLLPLAVATALWRQPGGWRTSDLTAAVAAMLASGVAAVLTFRVLNPYAFAGPGFWDMRLNASWWDCVRMVSRLQHNSNYPPSVQWAHRPLGYGLWNLAVWGMGVPMGLCAIAAMIVFARRMISRRDTTALLPWAWAVGCLAIFGLFVKAPTMRYLLPAYPPMAILAGALTASMIAASRKKHAALRALLAGATGVAVLAGTITWAWAFTRIYTREHTRVAATKWLMDRLPAGAAVANETIWDDALPLRLNGKPSPGETYRMKRLDIHGRDNAEKIDRLCRVLNESDWLCISSNRQWASMGRRPEKYPVTIAFYRELLGCPGQENLLRAFRRANVSDTQGRLGFELEAVFESFPSVGETEIDDQTAEEAFTVYDHPRVLIFRKTAAFDPQQLRAALAASLPTTKPAEARP
jgi:FkbM family methyltransferase